jgi:hypothetical protein
LSRVHLLLFWPGGRPSGAASSGLMQRVLVTFMPFGPIWRFGGSCTPGGSFGMLGMFGICTCAVYSHLPALIASSARAAPAATSASANTLNSIIAFPSPLGMVGPIVVART